MDSLIHQTAIVEPETIMGRGISVGPYAFIEGGAVIGDGSVIESHAVVKKWARIGEKARIGHHSVLGGDPQHLDFDSSTESFLTIGDQVRIGEGVTIHRSLYKGQSTKVGNESFLMGNSHVAHDSILGDRVILANGALLGGHVHVGDDTFVGGGAAVHQFVRIGTGSMVGGLAEISKDVGPHLLVMGRNRACGLNRVGLKRRNVSKEDIQALKRFVRELLSRPVKVKSLAEKLIEDIDEESSETVREFLEFFASGRRGFARSQKKVD